MVMKRNKISILSELLTLATDGCLKSHLVYQCNLNFKIIVGYLNHSIENGLMVHEGHIYRTTEKGKEYIGALENLKSISPLGT